MKKIALLSLFLLAGCVGLSIEPIFFKNGKQVYHAECHYRFRNMSDCYKLANQQCGGGDFEIVEKETDKDKIGSVEDRSSDVDMDSWYEGRVFSHVEKTNFIVPRRHLYFYCK